MKQLLADELARRAQLGQTPVKLSWIDSELRKLGYRIGKDSCRSIARCVMGDFEGIAYPCDTRQIFEIDTGLTFANYKARRDANFKRLQEIRLNGELFAVVRGYIVEL
jgi:hypothetical protein